MVYIEFFGDWNVYKDGIRVDEFKSKKALKILFYLLLSERSRVSVDGIIRTFWAGYEKDYARKNLNAQLYYIRKDLDIPDNYLKNEREYIYIEQTFFKSDYQEFMKASYLGDTETVRKVYRGVLLEGMDDDWIKKYRLKCQKIYEEVMRTSKSIVGNVAEIFQKLNIILQHQMITREKYFIPIAIKKEYVPKRFIVRRGDIILDLDREILVVLERGSKSYDEVIKGFLSRIKVNFDSIELLSEDETLRRLSLSTFGQSLTAN